MTTKLIKDAVTDVKREAWELTNESDWVAKTTLTAIRYTMIPMTDAMTRNTYMKGKDFTFRLQDNYNINRAHRHLTVFAKTTLTVMQYTMIPRTDEMTRNTYMKGKDFKLEHK